MHVFHLILPCANIFLVLPPPHKFSNGPSLMVLNENSNEHEYINHQLTGLSRKASLYPPIRETMAHKKALEILSSIG